MNDTGLLDIAGQLLDLMGTLPAEEKAALKGPLEEDLRRLLQLNELPSALAAQVGPPLSGCTPLGDWCRRRQGSGSFAETAFPPLLAAADVVDHLASTPAPLLAFLPAAWEVDDQDRLVVNRPRAELGRLNPALGQLTEFQRKHARRHLQPNLLRGLGEIDLPAASVFSFALFLLDVFLGIQGQTRAELQDALEKCRSRSGTGIPPGLPELFRPLVTASAGKPLGWTCRDLVAAVLRSYRDSPFICSPTFVLTVSHSRFAYSVPGLNKEGSNEDRYHVCRCGQATLLAVADGVSTADLGSGSLAAEEIVRWLDLTGRKRFEAAVARCLAEATAWPEEAERFLGEFFQSAHQHVIDQINGLFQGWTEAEPPKHPMCSTLVSAFVLGDQAIIRHVGDSPAWLYSPARNLFCKLTEEHHAGRERAFTFESDRQETALTRVIGDCELALSGKEYVAVEPRADLVRVQLRPGDLLLLSSDGLVDGIDEPETHARVTRLEGETRRLVQAGTDLKKLVRKLMALAEEGRSNDNITVAALRVDPRETPHG